MEAHPYTEEEVRGWMGDASAGPCVFPFEVMQDLLLEDALGNSIKFSSLYQTDADKRTIVMFGRNLL